MNDQAGTFNRIVWLVDRCSEWSVEIAKTVSLVTITASAVIMWTATAGYQLPSGAHLLGWHTIAAVIGTVVLVLFALAVIRSDTTLEIALVTGVAIAVVAATTATGVGTVPITATHCDGLPC
jgi:hypothetical protein